MAFLKLVLLVMCCGGLTLGATYNLDAPVVPDPVKTPGDVLTTDTKTVCISGYTKTARNVPQALKNQVYKAYGITSRQPSEYEVDHLISLELGGSNSVRNLWPQSYKTNRLNAHVKDTLENKLHALACGGQITLAEAQQAIAHDWEGAYLKYVGPLPGGKGSQSPAAAPPFPASPAPVAPSAATGSAVPSSDGSCPASAPIKISKSGIYHLPQGDASYSRTHAQRCYATPGAAQAAGYRAVR